MSETKFTPGKWKVGKQGSTVVSDSNKYLTLPGAIEEDSKEYYGGCLIAESISPNNIHLIAAAPDLYEALKIAKRYLKHLEFEMLDIDIKTIDEALKKANP